jgi:hypothetical protein
MSSGAPQRGRPVLTAEECRSVALSRVRVTPGVLDAVHTRAAQLGLPMAEFIRGAVLDRRTRPAVPQVNRETWAAGGPRRLLEDLRAAVSDLRRALLGRAEPPA